MSGNAPSQNPTTTKQTTDDSTNTPNALQQQKEQQEQQQEQQKRGPPLEEDDEFEDFPVDGRCSLSTVQFPARGWGDMANWTGRWGIGREGEKVKWAAGPVDMGMFVQTQATISGEDHERRQHARATLLHRESCPCLGLMMIPIPIPKRAEMTWEARHELLPHPIKLLHQNKQPHPPTCHTNPISSTYISRTDQR